MNQIHRLLVAACIASVSSLGLAAPAHQDSTNPAVSISEATSRGPERHTASPGGLVKVPIVKVMAIGSFSLSLIAAAHCIGWRATDALATRFKDRVVPSAVGKRFVV